MGLQSLDKDAQRTIPLLRRKGTTPLTKRSSKTQKQGNLTTHPKSKPTATSQRITSILVRENQIKIEIRNTLEYMRKELKLDITPDQFNKIIRIITGPIIIRQTLLQILSDLKSNQFKADWNEAKRIYNFESNASNFEKFLRIISNGNKDTYLSLQFASFSKYMLANFGLNPTDDFGVIYNIFSRPELVRKVYESEFKNKFKKLKQYFPNLKVDDELIKKIDQMVDPSTDMQKYAKVKNFHAKCVQHYEVHKIESVFDIDYFMKLEKNSKFIFHPNVIQILELIKRVFNIKFDSHPFFKEFAEKAYLLRRSRVYHRDLLELKKYVDRINPSDFAYFNSYQTLINKKSVTIPSIFEVIRNQDFVKKLGLTQKYNLKVKGEGTALISEIRLLQKINRLPSQKLQKIEKYLLIAQNEGNPVDDLETLFSIIKIPIEKLIQIQKVIRQVLGLKISLKGVANNLTEDNLKELLRSEVLQRGLAWLRLRKEITFKTLKEFIDYSSIKTLKRILLLCRRNKLIEYTSFWNGWEKYKKHYVLMNVDIMRHLEFYADLNHSDRKLLQGKNAQDLSAIIMRCKASKKALFGTIMPEVILNLLKRTKNPFHVLATLEKLVGFNLLFARILSTLEDKVPVELLENRDIIKKLINLKNKNLIQFRVMMLRDLQKSLSFLTEPKHEEFLMAINNLYSVNSKFSLGDEMLINLRILKTPNLFNTIKEPYFKTFINKLNTEYKVDVGVVDLPAITNFYRTLKAQAGGMDKIFSQPFKNFIGQMSKNTKVMNLSADLLNTIYKLYLSIDFKKIEEVKRVLIHPTNTNDLFLLNYIAKNPSLMFLVKNRKKLIQEVAKVYQRLPMFRKKLDVVNHGEVYTERPDLNSVKTLELLRILLLKQSLDNPQFLAKLGDVIKRDINDKTTEYGGYFSLNNGMLKIHTVSSISTFDGAYGNTSNRYIMKGVMSFHLHALQENSPDYTGPSGGRTANAYSEDYAYSGDIAYVWFYKQTDVVITTLGRTQDGKRLKINVDLYYVDSTKNPPKPMIIDMGIYEVPYN